MNFDTAYFDKLSTTFTTRQESINLYVLKKIAQRINDIKNLSTKDLNTLKHFIKSSNDMAEIQHELSKLFRQQRSEIKSIIRTAATDSYIASKPLFEYKKKKFIPFDDFFDMQDLVVAYILALQTMYTSFENSLVFSVTDRKTKKQTTVPISKAYSDILNIAIQAKRNPKIDFDLQVRPFIKQLIDSGLRVNLGTRSNPHIRNFDSVVNNSILNGIRDAILTVQNKVADILGADGVELSAHFNSAPDHELAQGHQFTKKQFEKIQNGENFEDLQGRKYIGFPRPIGAWNCRHITRSIFCGKTKPWYTDAELQKLIDDNAKGYTFPDGKHLTMYECTQEQRRMEREIRKLKAGAIVAKELGDDTLLKSYESKIASGIRKYNSFSKACGLSPKYAKIKVPGYD